MEAVLNFLHSLAVGILVGKVILLSFVVAPILAKQLERESFGKVVRQLFPAYYALGMGAAVLGLACAGARLAIHGNGALLFLIVGLWLVVLTAESYCRLSLTPRSNAMRDRLKELESRGCVDTQLHAAWNRLHQRSVYLNSLVLILGLLLIGLAS